MGLGALDAMRHGLTWVGVELELDFVDMGLGCDCTGMTRGEWVQFYGRWKRVNHKDGRYWCPRCVAEAGQVLPEPTAQLAMFGPTPTTSYVRNSGKIPHSLPHHYTGNIEKWRGYGLPGSAHIIQGDSRELARVVAGAGLCVSSSPWADADNRGNRESFDKLQAAVVRDGRGHAGQLGPSIGADYGPNPLNLGNLRATDAGFEMAVSSPVYRGARDDGGMVPGEMEDPGGPQFRSGAQYGQNPGQLAAMRQGSFDAAIGSPPWTNRIASMKDKSGFDFSVMAQHRTERWGRSGSKQDLETQARLDEARLAGRDYGHHPAQLGQMPEGDLQAVVSSPPWEAGLGNQTARPEFFEHPTQKDSHRYVDTITTGIDNYGRTPGNIGNTTGPDFWTSARTIMEQVYQVLAPGAIAIWVLKSFVRKGELVDFPGQWQALGEAVGFTTVETIRAWLVEDRGTQYDLEGEPVTKTVERKSFFRRLAERKGSPKIDFEIVLVQEKVNGWTK